MNEPHFEVFPEVRDPRFTSVQEAQERADQPLELTGEYVWHFQDANGRITHIGGEPFTRREDAHRSIIGTGADWLAILFGVDNSTALAIIAAHIKIPIVDLDENGNVIDGEPTHVVVSS